MKRGIHFVPLFSVRYILKCGRFESEMLLHLLLLTRWSADKFVYKKHHHFFLFAAA